MSMDYIRKFYNLNVNVGQRVEYTGNGKKEFGVVTGASGAHLEIQLDGAKFPTPYHPTWELKILEDEI